MFKEPRLAAMRDGALVFYNCMRVFTKLFGKNAIKNPFTTTRLHTGIQKGCKIILE